MSPKTKAPAAAKEAAPKKAGKETAPKKAAKGAKEDKKTEELAAAAAGPVLGEDGEEIDEDAAEEAASRSSGGDGNAAAMAAAAGGGEISGSLKNFRHHPDMENFYRFIYENDLRHEALLLIDQFLVDKAEKRATKGKGHSEKHAN